jgi:hypothetical protein
MFYGTAADNGFGKATAASITITNEFTGSYCPDGEVVPEDAASYGGIAVLTWA